MAEDTKREEPKAWRLQADTVSNMTFDTYRNELIHETPAIRNFLEDHRGEKFIISAPRGFGKTLLLLAKAAEVLGRTRIFNGAGGQIIDKPSGQFPNFSTERINNLKVDSNFWRNMWRISIQAACVKHYYRSIGKPIECGDIQCDTILDDAICHPDIYTSPCEFFVLLVGHSEREQMRIMQNTGGLSARFNTISSPIILFIDDVEEYFRPVLENRVLGNAEYDAEATGSEYYRVRSNALWTIAQCALVSAALELNETVSHVKIYCTIRHEAFLDIGKYDDRVQKIHGSTLQIKYSQADYRRIFDKNIALMASADLADSKADDLIERFVGQQCTSLRHRVMYTEQPIFDFILRHTVYRPRDLMLIGQAIAELRPEDRTEPELHRVIANATTTIVGALFTEMRPFFPLPDLETLACQIPKNTLTAKDIENINNAYMAQLKVVPQPDLLDHAPMSVLFRIGLLGIIRRNFIDVLPQQHFRKPFEITFEEGVSLPHTEEFYLIHPALDQYILHRNGFQYRHAFEGGNIIGDGRDWTEPLRSYFVMKGDVCQFSRIMDSDTYPLLIGRLESWAQSLAEDVLFYDLSGGDSILFIDKNPFRLLETTRRFLATANSFQEETVSLRFGGSAGPLLFHAVSRRRGSEIYDLDVPMGLPLRHAARIEPLAKPDAIVVDDAFRKRMLEMSNCEHEAENYSFTRIPPESVKLEANEQGKALVRKGPDDPAYPTNLWQVSASGR